MGLYSKTLFLYVKTHKKETLTARWVHNENSLIYMTTKIQSFLLCPFNRLLFEGHCFSTLAFSTGEFTLKSLRILFFLYLLALDLLEFFIWNMTVKTHLGTDRRYTPGITFRLLQSETLNQDCEPQLRWIFALSLKCWNYQNPPKARAVSNGKRELRM